MLQIHTTQGLDQIEVGLRMAAERHGGKVLAVSHVGQLLQSGLDMKGADAIAFTLCFPSLYTPLLLADIRFAGWTEIFMHHTPRGLPPYPTVAPITAELVRSRNYLTEKLGNLRS